MTYQDQLNPWVIHQLLPNLNRRIVARFCRRTEAEAYFKLLHQVHSVSQFAIAFDAPVSHATNSTASAPVSSVTTTPAVTR